MENANEKPTAAARPVNPEPAANPPPSATLADAHMKMAELHRLRWDVRRQDSWKITLAVWTILALGIIQGEASIPTWAVIFAAVAVPAIHIFWWINPIETRHAADVDKMFYFMESARFLLGEEIKVREPMGAGEASDNEASDYDPLAFTKAWTGLFQAAVTTLLACAFATSSLFGWFDKPATQEEQSKSEAAPPALNAGSASPASSTEDTSNSDQDEGSMPRENRPPDLPTG